MEVPKEIPAGKAEPINVEVRNQSSQNLRGLILHQLDTTKNYASDLTTAGPFDLPAGHTMKFKNLFVTIPKDDEPERDNRYMTAVMVEQPNTDLRAFDFAYVHRLGAKVLRQSENNSADFGAGSVPNNVGDSLAPPGASDADNSGSAR